MANVFIGIPTINRPEFVRDAINSVLKQTFADIEVIVSDNCSDDGVAESIKEFVEECDDQRIHFHQQAENVGEYGQGRYFLAMAQQSKYFMILHDDDMLAETYVEKGIACLEQNIDCSYFMADADIIDEHGNKTEQVTQQFLKQYGRTDAAQGEFSVIENYLKCGFTLISGTLFRTEALNTSGFVDEQGVGNYPFESDIFMHLGDIGAKAWYQKEVLLDVRFHTGSMRHYIKLLDNEKTVAAMINVFMSHEYTGYAERRRKVNLSRLYRAKALIAVRQGKIKECRKYIMKGFKYNCLSIKLWLIAPIALIVPSIMLWFLPELPITREAPLMRREN